MREYKIGNKVLVRGIVNSEVRNGGIHVLHDGVDAFYTLDQIHEPQKVVVPKFVAEWIEKCKRLGCSFRGAISSRTMPKEVDVWLSGLSGTKNILTNEQAFCSAWFYGYEIEQEQLYTVEIPNPNATHDDVYILGRTLSGSIAIWRSVGRNGNKNYDSDFQLTESEIKQDFEWAWQFATPVEVE